MPKIPVLQVQHCSKIYSNGFKAIDDVSFSMPQGVFTVLLGLNGAGKSSLIHMITGLSRLTQGAIRVMGNDITTQTFEAKKMFGTCPQEVNFNLFHSILQELTIAAGLYDMTESSALERIQPLLTRARLWQKRHEPIKNLSGGMKRILMVIRAMIHQPKLLILDEPTAGVDIEIRDMIWELLHDTHKDGTSVLLTTHNMQEAQKLCENILVLDQGRLLRDQSIQAAVKSLSSLQFTVSLNTPIDEAQTAWLNLNGHKIINDTSISLESSDDQPLSNLLGALIEQSLDIKSIHPTKNQLEQLLEEVTR